ncbi:unnamed protein product [Cylindrotheca closterium]|uniref:RING-type E3 ubiquitin transferase n=1 Tax=Cylindrotheca closterium TaxID=2856 RepID=A0AAD2CR40_9STRA|nr:unnamed protein product [Cylindrotheca closterium]
MPSQQQRNSRRTRGYPTASEIRGRNCMMREQDDERILDSVMSYSSLREEEQERTLTRLTPLRGYEELSERPSASTNTNTPPRPTTTTTTTRSSTAGGGKARPVCHFFALNGSCRNGDNCAFSHNVTPGDTRSVVCSFFRKGNCRYGDSCRFSHNDGNDNYDVDVDQHPATAPSVVCQPCNDNDNTSTTQQDDDEDEELMCGICMEHPTKFGLLSCCDHVFCFECLMEWRSSCGKEEVYAEQKSLVKVCPVCRTHSDYVLSSYTYAKTGNGKQDLMEAHKLRLSQIPCKRFNGDLGSCPFGRDCFYRHWDDYGNDIKHLDQSKQDIQEELERRKLRRQLHFQSQQNIDAELDILEAQLALLQLGLASFAFQLDI